MELLIQFGYVVVFAGVMPLLPLFALINNIAEIRIDADKYITQTKRLLPNRVRSIHPWLVLLRCLSRLAIFTNAFIFAFDTTFPGAMLLYARPSMLKTETHTAYFAFPNGVIDPNEWTFDMPSVATTITARYDWGFRFRLFPAYMLLVYRNKALLTGCYKYDEETKTVDVTKLADPLPPRIDELEQELNMSALLNMSWINHIYSHYLPDGVLYEKDRLMMQCRGGVLYEGGYEIDDKIIGKLRKRLDNVTSAEELAVLRFDTQYYLNIDANDVCWANYYSELQNNTLVINDEHYHVRFAEFTCAIVFILVASTLQAISQYLVPEHSASETVHEQRKHYVFRKTKKTADADRWFLIQSAAP